MKILVTGANGYIGRGVVKELSETGNEIIAQDIHLEDIPENVKGRECDLFDIKEAFSFFGYPDIVLHLAWRNGFIHNHMSHIEELPKHYRFIKDLLDGGLKKIAVMGSMHEIGFYEGSIREDTPANPLSLYGIGKNALRQMTMLEAKAHGASVEWLRGYYIVGNTEYGSSVFSKIARAEKEGKKEFPFTMGQNQWDFTDYEDFCHMTVMALLQDRYQGIINICSGYPERLKDRAERFIRENNFNIKLKFGAFPDRPYDSKAVWGDDVIIKKILEEAEKQNV